MASIFKSLKPSDYTVTPFPAYYQYQYTYVSGSTSNSADIDVSYAEKFVTSSYTTRYPNIRYELYDSIVQTFYSPIPYTAYGIRSGSSFIPQNRIQVFSITQNVYGEKILPGSFTLTLNTSKSYDDGKGNIIVSSSGTGSVVGAIFYDKGITVLQSLLYGSLTAGEQSSGVLDNRGIYIASASSVEINFSSSVTLYENTYKVKLEPTDFLYGFNNPSSNDGTVPATGPFSGSVTRPKDLMVTSSATAFSGSRPVLLPYVTTIGFYNDNNELLMVAKPSVPIQRTMDIAQTFIVRYDT